MNLIRIPEANSYGVAILVVSGLASFALSAHLYARWFARRRVRVLHVYVAVLTLVAAWGVLVVGPPAVTGSAPAIVALSLPIAVVAGLALRRLDLAIVRHASRRKLRAGAAPVPARHDAATAMRSVQAFGDHTRSRSLGVHRVQRSTTPTVLARELGTVPIVVAGALEEVFYRGALIDACRLMPSSPAATALICATVPLFALAHIWFGWVQVIAKVPLGAGALVLVLAFGSIVPAIVAHATFNLGVLSDLRAGRYPLASADTPPIQVAHAA